MADDKKKKVDSTQKPEPDTPEGPAPTTETQQHDNAENNKLAKDEKEKSLTELINDLYEGADSALEETAHTMESDIQAAVDKELKALKKVHTKEIEDVKRGAGREVVRIQNQAEKDIKTAKEKGTATLARDILELADNFKRAVDDVTEEDLKSNKKLETMVDGIKAMSQQLQDAFSHHGIEKIDALGTKLDPHKHQALTEVVTTEHDPGTIAEVVQEGYMINERVLRHAKVIVAKAP